MVVTIVHDGQVVKNLTVFNTENGPAVKFYKRKNLPVKDYYDPNQLIGPEPYTIVERIELLRNCKILQSSVEISHTYLQNQILHNVKFDYARIEQGPWPMYGRQTPMKINEDLPND